MSECIHTSNGSREYIVRFEPNDWGLSLDNCIVEGFERIGSNRLRLSVGDNPYDQTLGRVSLTKYMDYGIVEDSVLLWRCSMPADEPYPVSLEIGVGETGDFKRILPRHSTNPPEMPLKLCKVTLATNLLEHPATVHLSCPKLRFGPDWGESLTATLTPNNPEHVFYVYGQEASEAMDDAVISVRRDDTNGPICTSKAMTIVWVDPITMRKTPGGTFAVPSAYYEKPIPSLLGPRSYRMESGFEGLAYILEFDGLVHPSDFPYELLFARDNTDTWGYCELPAGGLDPIQDETDIAREPESRGNDTPPLESQSCFTMEHGHIYNYDTPGLGRIWMQSHAAESIGYLRMNFLQYVQCNGIRCSNDFAWWVRVTVKNEDSPDGPVADIYSRPEHVDDNNAGTGITNIGKNE